MATSGIATFTISTYQVINLAVKCLGKLGINDNLEPEEYNDALMLLNLMVKQWMVKSDSSNGIKMWQRIQGFLFLSTATGQYALGSQAGTGLSYFTNNFLMTTSGGSNNSGATTINVASTNNCLQNMQPDIVSQYGVMVPNQYIGIELDNGSLFWTTIISAPTSTTVVLDAGIPSSCNSIGNIVYTFTTIARPPQIIEVANLRDAQGNDTLMTPLSKEEWAMLPSKQAPNYSGDPIAYYYEPHLVGNSGQGVGYLNTDVASAQDVSKYIVLNYVREFDDFVNPGDEPDFPKEFGLPLVLGLAKILAPFYNVVWTDSMEKNTITSFMYAKNAQPKTAVLGFAPGNRGFSYDNPWWR